MSLIHRAAAFFKLLSHRKAMESDLDEEVSAFFETVTQRYIERGIPPGEASRLARLKFTSPDQVKEQVRDEHVGAALASLVRNVQYSFRTFRKSPAFALVTVITLALGIAANVTIFPSSAGLLSSHFRSAIRPA